MITQIGDTNVRLYRADGTSLILTNDKLIDAENATIRAQTITRELAAFAAQAGREPTATEYNAMVDKGRAAIVSRLKTQYLLQNSATDQMYGYGILDGSAIPPTHEDVSATNYVQCYHFTLGSIATVELVSDGFYGAFPTTPQVADYQRLYHHIHQTDPAKYTAYPSTKPKDDASVVLAAVRP